METIVSLTSNVHPPSSALPVVTSSLNVTTVSPSTIVTERKWEIQKREVYSCNKLIGYYGT